MTPEETARHHADAHSGYELVSYGELGLPFFELRIRAEVLEHKRIDPFAEFVLSPDPPVGWGESVRSRMKNE